MNDEQINDLARLLAALSVAAITVCLIAYLELMR